MRRLDRRRRLGAAGLLGVATWLLAGALLPGSAQAVVDVEVGSWWAGQASAGASPAPPQVPDDGLWVSTNPNGATAISAVRFRLADREAEPILTLRVASHLPPGSARVLACRVTSEWQPVFVGPLAAAPTYDADDCAGGLLAGTALQFDLARLVTDGRVDVALVPVTDPAPPALPATPVPVPAVPVPGVSVPDVPPLFDITFDPVDDTAFAVSAVGPPLTTPVTVPPDTVAPATPGAGAPSVTSPSGLALPRPATPARPAPAASPAPTAPRPVVTPAPTLVSAPIEFLGEEWRWARALAALVLVGVAAWWLRVSATGADEAPSTLATRFPTRDGAAPALR